MTNTGTTNFFGGSGVTIVNNTGTVDFASLDITNPISGFSAASAIVLGGTIGAAVDFGDLDIALQSDDTTGLNLSGATINADVTASDFDLTSTTATGTVGVDLTGTTGTGRVTLGTTTPPFDIGPDSTIAGVDSGILFSSDTDLVFTFGDGEATVDVGSTIDAGTPIDDDGSGPPVSGAYNFDDI